MHLRGRKALVALLGLCVACAMLALRRSWVMVGVTEAPLFSTSSVDPEHTTGAPWREGSASGSAEEFVVDFIEPKPANADKPRRPAHLEAALAKHRELTETNKGGGGRDNTVSVDQDDIARAQLAVIHPMPPLAALQLCGRSTRRSSGDSRRRRSEALYEALRDYVQAAQVDAEPIVVDYGCVLGPFVATALPSSTVFCVASASPQNGGGSDDDAGPLHASDVACRKNLFPLRSSASAVKKDRTFTTAPFTNFYATCNLVSTSFVLDDAGQSSDADRCSRLVEHLNLLLPASKLTFVAVCSQCRASVMKALSAMATQDTNNEDDGGSASSRISVAVTEIATLRSASHSTTLLRIVLLSSRRACAKTWGAPLVQWDRRLLVGYRAGVVTFRVVSAKANGQALGRTIHPLQYRPSVNLDTLLGAGLPVAMRQRLLAQMIATPRYSDPLPHNWVMAGGGSLVRIDKVDLRYDREVDESKGYWGHSTRGYLHLFGYHLCLPLTPGGLPLPGAGGESSSSNLVLCRTECDECADSCSYLPKGSAPCAVCVACSTCLDAAASAVLGKRSSSGRQDDALLPAPSCQKTYSSMHAARNVWKKWEKADRAGRAS